MERMTEKPERTIPRIDIRPLGRLAKLHSILINKQTLGRTWVDFLRKSPQTSWLLDRLVPSAFADDTSETELENVLEVAALPDKKPSRFSGFSGLPLIHESESSMNEIIQAPSMIGQDTRHDDESNFLGEITVEAGTVKITKPERIKQ